MIELGREQNGVTWSGGGKSVCSKWCRANIIYMLCTRYACRLSVLCDWMEGFPPIKEVHVNYYAHVLLSISIDIYLCRYSLSLSLFSSGLAA